MLVVCFTEMDLFSVVKLAKPTQVTVGVRPMRDGEAPIFEATAGRTVKFVQEELVNASPVVLEATLVRSVPTQRVQPQSGTQSPQKVWGSLGQKVSQNRQARE